MAKNPTKTITQWLKEDAARERIQSLAPPSMRDQYDIADQILIYMNGIKSEKARETLEKCSHGSFLAAVGEILRTGLLPDQNKVNIQAMWNKDAGEFQAAVQYSYQGKVDRLLSSGAVSYIRCETHHENDEFEIVMGTQPRVDHVPSFEDRGKIKGVWGIVQMKDGSQSVWWMSVADVERCRGASRTGDNDYGPWATDYEEMAKKSLFHNMCKWFKLDKETYELLRSDFTEYDFRLRDGKYREEFNRTHDKALKDMGINDDEPDATEPENPQTEEDVKSEDHQTEPQQENEKTSTRQSAKDKAKKYHLERKKSSEKKNEQDVDKPEEQSDNPSTQDEKEVEEPPKSDSADAPEAEADESLPDPVPLPTEATPWPMVRGYEGAEEVIELRQKARANWKDATLQVNAFADDKYDVPYWEMLPVSSLQKLANPEMKLRVQELLEGWCKKNKYTVKFRALTAEEASICREEAIKKTRAAFPDADFMDDPDDQL